MKTIKTNELTEAALDWAVAKCEGVAIRWSAPHEQLLIVGAAYSVWQPHKNWSQGGPIIDREEIGFFQKHDEGYAQAAKPCAEFVKRGPTPLIAAMRAYVASKLGDEVKVPDELTQ